MQSLEFNAGDDFVTGGTDAWRYDETVLDDLEDFLNKVEGSEEKAAPAEADPQALKLLEEVRFELAEARGEVAQLTTENRLMTNRLDGSGDTETEYARAMKAAEAALETTNTLYSDYKDACEEASRLGLKLYAVPDSVHAEKTMVPNKKGAVKLNKMTLLVDLVGGQTLELINESKEGHKHVSKLDLTFIDEVGVVVGNETSFKVKSKNGSYIMTAGTAQEAKSWARAIEISIKVAKKKMKERGGEPLKFF